MKKKIIGHDDVSTSVIKEIRDIISPFLEYIINKSFVLECFPDSLQTARVVPIFKKGDQSNFSNFLYLD